METLCFSVYDAKAQVFSNPMYARTRGEAVRSFIDAVNAENHEFRRHAEDYTLFLVGSFDVVTGCFTAMTPESMGNAMQYREAD